MYMKFRKAIRPVRKRAIQNLMQLPPDDKVRAIIDVKDLRDKDFVNSHNIVLCTKKGVIKKTLLEEFSRPRQNGVNAITILEGDELFEAKLTSGTSEIMMAVKSGRAIRFPEDRVRLQVVARSVLRALKWRMKMTRWLV
jgi:DNA gyrase subunit A